MEYPLREAKGLRPALCIATCRALGGSLEAVLPSAAVLELYHNAFLIHDDVEDGSERRRGMPTLHRDHGAPIAINVGDAMLGLALSPLLDNTGSRRPRQSAPHHASRRVHGAGIGRRSGDRASLDPQRMLRAYRRRVSADGPQENHSLQLHCSGYDWSDCGNADAQSNGRVTQIRERDRLCVPVSGRRADLDGATNRYGKERFRPEISGRESTHSCCCMPCAARPPQSARTLANPVQAQASAG